MKQCSAQEAYLKKQSMRKFQVRFLRVFLLLVFLGLWQCAADFGWIDSFIFSSPVKVVRTFYNMCLDHSLSLHIGVTLAETLISFGLTILFTVAIAVLLWGFPKFADVSHILWYSIPCRSQHWHLF